MNMKKCPENFENNILSAWILRNVTMVQATPQTISHVLSLISESPSCILQNFENSPTRSRLWSNYSFMCFRALNLLYYDKRLMGPLVKQGTYR